MAGIPLRAIVKAAFPGIGEGYINQVCSLASNYHLNEVDFGFTLEALQANRESETFDDVALGELKRMVTKGTSKARGKENRRAPPPAPAVPAATNSIFSRRTDSGQVLVELSGPSFLPVVPEVTSVVMLTEPPTGYYHNASYAKVASMNERLAAFKDIYSEMYEKKPEDRVTRRSEMEITVVGRVVSEDGGKLSAANLCLQDKSDQVELDVSGMTDFVLYPGKIVAAVGHCNGIKFSAESFLQLPVSPKKEKDVGESVHVVVACGPYTALDNLDFEPLKAILNVLKVEKCGCLILCGPFLDAEHPMFKEEATPRSSVLEADYTYDEAINTLINKVESFKLGCQVIVVPSVQDLAQMTPVPQQPYSCFSSISVSMATNPCCFMLNGLLFGISTVDILREIAVGSFSRSTHPVNRIRQAFSEMLEQRSFLPFSPCEVPVDMQHADLLHLSASPDVLVVASKMAKSVEVLGDTVCVNPGMLTRGNEGGSYARIQISSGEVSIRDRTQVKIIQI